MGEIPTGQVRVSPIGDGWYLVEIGRARRTVRFNLARAEIVTLVAVLSREVLTADRPT